MQETPFYDDVGELFGYIHLPSPPSDLVQYLSNIVLCLFGGVYVASLGQR